MDATDPAPGDDRSNGGLAARLTRLEARVDGLEHDLKQVLTTVLTGLGEIKVQIEVLRGDMNARFAEQDRKFEARFIEQDRKFETRFAEQDLKFEARFAAIDQRFVTLEAAIVERIAGLDRRMADSHAALLKEIHSTHQHAIDRHHALIEQMSRQNERLAAVETDMKVQVSVPAAIGLFLAGMAVLVGTANFGATVAGGSLLP